MQPADTLRQPRGMGVVKQVGQTIAARHHVRFIAPSSITISPVT